MPPASAPVKRRALAGDKKHQFAFKYSGVTGADFTREILETQIPFELIGPRHELQDIWNAPVFFADSRHVFVVTTEERPVWIRQFEGFGISVSPGVLQAAQIPPLVVQTAPPPKPTFWGERGPIAPDRGVVDPVPMQTLVSEDAYIRLGLPTTLNVKYGDQQIGPLGAIPEAKAKA